MDTIVVRIAEAQDSYFTYTIPTTFATHTRHTPTVVQAENTKHDSTPTNTPAPSHDKSPWANMAPGLKSGIALVCFLIIFLVIVLSVWFCCGCCGLRQKRRERRRTAKEAANPNPRHLELSDVQEHQRRSVAMGVMGVGEAPPPQYDEVVPPQHRTIAGGITHVREEEQGIISDGKTPLSEIAFEDVVLDHSPSEGSARTFEERHYQAGGDTTGHTNV